MLWQDEFYRYGKLSITVKAMGHGLGLEAVEAGYKVIFISMGNLIKI